MAGVFGGEAIILTRREAAGRDRLLMAGYGRLVLGGSAHFGVAAFQHCERQDSQRFRWRVSGIEAGRQLSPTVRILDRDRQRRRPRHNNATALRISQRSLETRTRARGLIAD
jgi:hypothetical protein